MLRLCFKLICFVPFILRLASLKGKAMTAENQALHDEIADGIKHFCKVLDTVADRFNLTDHEKSYIETMRQAASILGQFVYFWCQVSHFKESLAGFMQKRLT